MATPDNTNRVVDVALPICVPIVNTSTPDKRDPAKAPVVILFIPIVDMLPSTITATAPHEAPDDIPNI